MGKLITLLEPTSFKGPEYEKYIDKDNLYDWNKLIVSIQASEKELKDALIQYSIASLDGNF